MNVLKKIALVLACITILPIGIGIYIAVLYYTLEIAGILKENNEIAISILFGTVPLFFTAIGWLYKDHREKCKQIEFEIRKEKLKLYSDLVPCFIDFGKRDVSNISNGLAQRFFDVLDKGILWFSDDTIKTLNRYRETLDVKDINSDPEWAEKCENVKGQLLLALRKEVGHSNQGIKGGDLNQILRYNKSLLSEQKNDVIH